VKLFRGAIFTPIADPFAAGSLEESFRYWSDGYLAVADDGTIEDAGDWQALPSDWSSLPVEQLRSDQIVTPGLIDTHLHAPQLEMIGSYGGHLLEWLETWTFPTELKFADPAHADRIAEALFRELLRNGTTTALIFSTTHTAATESFFRAAENRGFRAIIGKTLMDRNAPAGLLEPPQKAFEESQKLIDAWHRRGRLRYAVTPRFAPTCTPEMLEAAGELVRRNPGVSVHTHISENTAEMAWVRQLFPDLASYAAVYDHFGLLTDRTVLAHGVHLSDQELELLAARGTAISHCPNSNLFLGSGLFPLQRVSGHGVRVGLGSDIGAGTTPSILGAMGDAYKVQQVRNVSLSPIHLWYLGTLGGARALSLDQVTGSLERGKDADFVVLDLKGTPLLALRSERAGGITDLLAGLIFIGDDRMVARTYIGGAEVYRREE
jgi:guanine deaminase